MKQSLTDFIKRVDAIRKSLNGVKSVQLQSQSLKSEIRKVIEDYFDKVRPGILQKDLQDSNFTKIDKAMQDLLPLCHKKGSTSTYKTSLTTIRKLLIEADSKIISSFQPPVKEYNEIDMKIIDTLEKILPSAALSYKQAVEDLSAANRFSWRGPATDLRESLRETLDHLAPDADVKAMSGYKQSPETSGPTMKQKVKYILTKRSISKTKTEASESAVESVESSVGTFVRSVYTRSSISTHTPTDKTEVIRVRNFVRAVLCELLEIDV